MAKFSNVISKILDIEKGYTNDSDDAGGETKFGISKRQYPNLDISNLTQDAALQIYERDFWNAHKLSNIDDQEIANKIFILIVNMNAIEAIKLVQHALVDCGVATNNDIDGIMGSRTIDMLNSLESMETGLFLNWLFTEEITHYVDEVYCDHSQIKYIRGWTKRALS